VDLQTFERSLTSTKPPAGVPGALEALWHERRGSLDEEWRAIVTALLAAG
jgi:hypothetical protein